MLEHEWEMFFELLEKIVDMPNMTANEKAELVKEKADEEGGDLALNEFTAWDWS